MTEETLFAAALEKATPAERAAFLAEVCSENEALRLRVEALLQSHDHSEFLRNPAVNRTCEERSLRPGNAEGIRAAVGVPTFAEYPGMVIGPYKLLQELGEGGMGVVFMAEQTQPVHRKVALKIIKPGMDSRQVIARFEAERQALAVMDHVNIARVFDGGTTEAGRPYFVMELIHGVPITKYCDDNHLTPRERLELFVPVCNAIQHAHQKGIIHRDIKPTNVMVTLYDGKPVPKVIDFGVAKATEQNLTERTLFTQYGTMVGTLEYMSPEQAETSALGVDTRSDVYSLGVLMYELLTGTTPLTRKQVQEAAFGEILRIIKEEEPPKPSTRLSDSGEALASISAQRKTEPAKLSKLMRGELDWIVMKCLDKDRNRRYQSAGGFAADVQRYLQDEPVQACPPSAAYRFRKFSRRNRVAFSVTALVAAGLIIAVVMLAVSNGLIRQEQARTRQEQSIAVQSQRTAEERAEQLRQGVLDLQAAHRLLERGRSLLDEQYWDDADEAFTRAIALRPNYAGPWDARADLYIRLGLFDLAMHDLNRAYELQEPVSGRWLALAILRLNGGDAPGCREASVLMRQQTRGAGTREFAVDAVRVAALLPDADTDPREAVALAKGLADAEPANAFLRYLLGLAHYRAQQFEQAATKLHEALALEPGWASRRMVFSVLAMTYHRLSRDTGAHHALAEAAQAIDEWTGQICKSNHGNSAINQGVGSWPVRWWDWLECQLFYREAKLLLDGSPPPEDPRMHVIRARAFAGLRRTRMAIDEYDAAVAGLPNDSQIQFERCRTRGYYYGYSNWPQAAREFGQARRLKPDQSLIWNFEAISQLGAGNPEAYQQICAEMLARFAATQDARAAQDIVFACVLRAKAVPDPAQLVALARVAARLHHGNGRVIGAACCRAGQYDEAVRQLEESARLNLPRCWEWCFLAMAHHHLGHRAEAIRCLQAADRWITEADRTTTVDVRHSRLAWGGFTERFEFPLLYAEAAALIGVSEADAAALKTQDQPPTGS